MKPINIVLFKRFMRGNGLNQIFAGLYRQFHFPESPEDVEEYLEKVDANDVILNAFRFPKSVEGYDSANWILLDFGDIIVHVFDNENRLFYDLERIWRDGKVVFDD